MLSLRRFIELSDTDILQIEGVIPLFGGVVLDGKLVGKRIQEARIACGLTQAELAQQLDITTKHMSALETGNRSPKLETFVDIANAVHCDPNMLLVDVINYDARAEYEELRDKLSKLPAAEQRRILKIIDLIASEYNQH